MKKIALLASYNGSVLDAILPLREKLSFELSIIISNNTDANVLKKAALHQIPYKIINSKTTTDPDTTLYKTLQEHDIDLVLLAGYMKKLPAKISNDFFIVNSHPALLPKYGGKGMYGKHVHQAVIHNQEKESGVTVHQVNENYDEGEIILQKKVILDPNETAESLEKKVKEVEKKAVIEALAKCLNSVK